MEANSMKSLVCAVMVILLAAQASGGQESINLRRTTTVEVVEKTKNAVV
jgi:hypothetical protein